MKSFEFWIAAAGCLMVGTVAAGPLSNARLSMAGGYSSDRRRGIRFEIEDGKVSRYYVGTAQAIQYVEGCSSRSVQ